MFHSVLTQLARRCGIPEERLDWVALALREAVNNAVLHGNKKDPSKFIEVEFDADENEFVMKVWDEGPGFDDRGPGGSQEPREPVQAQRSRNLPHPAIVGQSAFSSGIRGGGSVSR